MKLVKTTKAMENELKIKEQFSEELAIYLSYTRKFYLLKKEGVNEMTSEKVTLEHLQARMDLTDYAAYILDDNEAIKALEKSTIKTEAVPKTKVAPSTKKSASSKSVKKNNSKEKPKAKKEETKKTTKAKNKKNSDK